MSQEAKFFIRRIVIYLFWKARQLPSLVTEARDMHTR